MKRWFGLLLFLFILGCNSPLEESKQIDEPTVQKCDTIENYYDKKICELVLDKPNLQQCLVSNTTSYKFFCIALITQDSSICEYITPLPKEKWCKAYITRDANFCDTIQKEPERDECYTDLGINFKDITICNKIRDQKSRISCEGAATQKPNLCLEGAEEYKVNCIVNVVESTGNKELCSILVGEQKTECFEQIK